MPDDIAMATNGVNGDYDEPTVQAVAEYIREAVQETERALLDEGKRTPVERWVDLVDSNKWLSSALLDAKFISPLREASLGTKSRGFGRFISGLAFLISSVLRGFGQVVFQDNPWTGAFVCVAGGLPHWPTAIMGILGCTITTVFPLLVQPPETRALVASGLYGFNGVLLGWGYATFDNNIQQADTFASGIIALLRALPALLFLGILTGILHVVISRSFTKATRIPPLTWPYNIALLMWMACATLSTNYGNGARGESWLKPFSEGLWESWFFEAWLRGVSQVVFSPDLWSGVVLLIGILFGSPYSVFLTAYGALIGLLTGMGIGLDFRGMLDSGLVCYNPVLVALSLGGFYVAPSLKGFILMTFGCMLSVIAFQGVVNLLVLPNGGPALTAPFCITVTILFGAMSWDFIDGLPVLFPRQLTCTERHWALKSRTQRAIRVVRELESGSDMNTLVSSDVVRDLGRAVSMKVQELLPVSSMRRSSEDGYAETLLSKAGLHHWHHHMVTYGEEGKDHGDYSLQKVAAIAEYAAKYELLRTVFLRCCEFGSECSLMDSILVGLNAADGFPASLKEQAVLSARRVCGPEEASEIGIIFGGRDFDNKPLEGIISDCATMAVNDSV
ncbi:hypothetical protein FOZ61_001338 [Perkinsus olseni]|uniref:Urea transporter n=1 Tax=Perkinsus olseni TaxID=32597 RepID=A0A7J6LXB3_PEROL|nr:hypothetical protein FOZ61_001338 [Perkinsus olseni]